MEYAVVLKVDVNNPDLGDMFLDNAGQEVLRTVLSEEVAQRLTVRFNFFLGEWFLDTAEGTPWVERILVKAPSDLVIRTVIGNIVRTTEGVVDMTKFSYSISRDRRLALTIEAKLADGSTFRTTDYSAFVLDLSNVT